MHFEGLHMTVWDQHADFLAKDAAYLVTQDEFETVGLLKLMHDAYEKALNQTGIKYDLVLGSLSAVIIGPEGKAIPLPYTSVDDPLPEYGLYSRRLNGHIQEIFDQQADTDWYKEMIDLYRSWRKDKTGSTQSSSSLFEVQRFQRKEIDRWLKLRGIESKYAFVQNSEAPSPNPSNEPIDISVLVAPFELMKVFERWGLNKKWFNELKNHEWLSDARKTRGRGGRNPIFPLFCPYEVMVGLRTESRLAKNRYSEETGWRLLRQNFPKVFSKFEHLAPDIGQSEN